MRPSNITRRTSCTHTYDFQRQAMSCIVATAVRDSDPNTFAQNTPQHCTHNFHAGSPTPIAPTTANRTCPRSTAGLTPFPTHRIARPPGPSSVEKLQFDVSIILCTYCFSSFLHLSETRKRYFFYICWGSRCQVQNKTSCELCNIRGIGVYDMQTVYIYIHINIYIYNDSVAENKYDRVVHSLSTASPNTQTRITRYPTTQKSCRGGNQHLGKCSLVARLYVGAVSYMLYPSKTRKLVASWRQLKGTQPRGHHTGIGGQNIYPI